MSDNIMYTSIWGIIGVVIISVNLSLAGYWTDHNTKIVNLIKEGINPVAAMCAMQDDYGDHPVCIILAVKEGLNRESKE